MLSVFCPANQFDHFPYSGFWSTVDSVIIENDVLTDLFSRFFFFFLIGKEHVFSSFYMYVCIYV